MRTIRVFGSIALWIGALLGIAAGGVWVAGEMGVLQPMIVISGSMEPEIMTGDLLLDRRIRTEGVQVGDVLTLDSELTGKAVTHRVVSIEPLDEKSAADLGVERAPGEDWLIRMKGDANAEDDLEPYTVGDEVLTPWVQIPQGGKVVSKIMEPAVAMPILLALVALLGLSLLDEPKRQVVRRVIERVRQRDPRVDELDLELAAAGVDVVRLQDMDDLDLQLYALGIDLPATDRDVTAPTPSPDPTDPEDQVAPNLDPLWDFALPDTDGIGLVHPPDHDPPHSRPAPAP